jgi:hypothetical protein
MFHVLCPCGSGAIVAGDVGKFSDTSCVVTACDSCRKAGIVSRNMKKGWCLGNALVGSAGVQHVDGLVVMSG